MIRKILSLLVALSAISVSARYVEVHDTLRISEIYPGTVHTMIITLPQDVEVDSYGLYVGLDGILCNAPAVIDSMSIAGAMPPTVGVYLQPGLILDNEGNVLRYNRSNEFDATDERFSSFLEKELLLYVEARHGVKISDDPSQRMIFGLSSGGIAAFTAAWHRPDMFGKVFCGCGTFVPMRGGNDLQAIVRKHEPKPLRIYLQDGFKDSWNPLFGSWFEANYQLGTALEFAGYDARFDWAEGVHSVKRASQIFPEVMRWMWRDYPNSRNYARATQNNLFKTILENATEWEIVESVTLPAKTEINAIYPDGSHIAEPIEGSNYLSQSLLTVEGDKLYTQPFYWLHTYDNSVLTIADMSFDGEGNLWVLTNAGIQICDQNGRVRGIIALPVGFDLNQARLQISDGKLTIISPCATYSRQLNITAPTPGVRPKSQGQA